MSIDLYKGCRFSAPSDSFQLLIKKRYRFDEGNYLETISEWPDAESTELSEQSKPDTLDTIEAVTGKVTSYGVIYSTNGFEVY